MMIIKFFITQPKILSFFSNLFAKIYDFLINLKIPDIALIAIILLLLVWILTVSKRVEKRLEERIEEIKKAIRRAGIEDFQEELKHRKVKKEATEEEIIKEKFMERAEAPEGERVEPVSEHAEPERKEVQERLEPEEKIELNKEDIFVLSAIADEPEKICQKEGLFSLYRMAFSTKAREDFDAVLKKLGRYKLIKSDESTDYRTWVELTDNGLEYIKKKRRF